MGWGSCFQKSVKAEIRAVWFKRRVAICKKAYCNGDTLEEWFSGTPIKDESDGLTRTSPLAELKDDSQAQAGSTKIDQKKARNYEDEITA